MMMIQKIILVTHVKNVVVMTMQFQVVEKKYLVLTIVNVKKKNITECKEPNYLCCDDDNDPKDYTCEKCEECCILKDAISSNGEKVPCPDYCNCSKDEVVNIKSFEESQKIRNNYFLK